MLLGVPMRELSGHTVALDDMLDRELPELLALSDRVYVLYQGAVAAELPGGADSEEDVLTATMGAHSDGH